MNNLDPEVAENPHELVVYGGIGRAARNWECFDAIVAALRALDDDETLLIQSGKPVGVFKTHADAPRVLHRQLEPRAEVGDVGALQRARPQGPHDVRPDDGRLVDLHRQPGHRAGHLRDLRRSRAPALRRRARGQVDPDRGPRRHGRRAAARRDDGRRVDARDRMPASRASTCGSRRATSTGRRRPRRSARDRCATRARQGARSRSACSATRPRSCPSSCGAACAPTSSPTRRRRTTSSTATCPSGWTVEQWQAAQADPAQHAEARRAPRSDRSSRTSRRCSRSTRRASPTFDYGNNIRQVALDEGVADAFDFPGFVPAYIRPLFCEGKGPFRWVALSGDPEDIYKTDAR